MTQNDCADDKKDWNLSGIVVSNVKMVVHLCRMVVLIT